MMDTGALMERHGAVFGGGGGLRLFAAPGRVNLIGEHTDYNGGWVFPAAISLGNVVAARPRADRRLRLAATDLPGVVEADLDALERGRGLPWGSYQLGVADELQREGLRLVGADLLFDGDLPFGAGLSSSASIEVATAAALVGLAASLHPGNPFLGPVDLARICQRAENRFVGVSCGIMDQFASAVGRRGFAMLLRCDDLHHRHVPLRLDGHALVIVNTNRKRSLGDGKYNERRAECERGLAVLQQRLPALRSLGELTAADLDEHADAIADPVVRRRVEHVVSEDDRVLASVAALEAGDLGAFGGLMIASHASLRDLYEVTGPELDALVEEALAVEGTVGSRMTGAGFGGCTVSLVRDDAVERFIATVGPAYRRRTGLEATFIRCETAHGGRELEV